MRVPLFRETTMQSSCGRTFGGWYYNHLYVDFEQSFAVGMAEVYGQAQD